MKQKEMSFKDWYNPPSASQAAKLNEYKDFCSANRTSFQEKKLEKFFKKIENFGI